MILVLLFMILLIRQRITWSQGKNSGNRLNKLKNYKTYNNEQKEQVFASSNEFQIKRFR